LILADDELIAALPILGSSLYGVAGSPLAKARNAKTSLQSHQRADSHQTITCEVIAAILDLSDSKAVAEQDFL
jgi:hypothetical protein